MEDRKRRRDAPEKAPASKRSRRPPGGSPELVTIRQCENLHAFFFPHTKCPLCSARTRTIESHPAAILLCHTTVRVSPTGSPFKLGIARVACGAQTLCIVESDIELEQESEVTLVKRGELYYAAPKTAG